MKRLGWVFASAVLSAGPALAAPLGEAGLIAQGRYIVSSIGTCDDCHSPRGPTGELIPGQRLTGAPIGFVPVHPMPVWADRAPRIAGLPAGYTEQQLVAFLQTGRRPNGTLARPPMPAFRLNERDARAVAAYLKSLH